MHVRYWINRYLRSGAVLFAVLFFAPLYAEEAGGAVKKKVVPDGFLVQEYLGGLSDCVALAFAPDGRLFYLEKNSGRVMVIEEGKPRRRPWIDLQVGDSGERGLLGIAFDPDFEKNRYVYLYYSVLDRRINRVIRLMDVKGRGVKPWKVIEIPDNIKAPNKNGGKMVFGPDGYLYVSTGDGGGKAGTRSQDGTNLLGKILRIDVRGELPVRYKEPSELFYARGLRNSNGLAWNPDNDLLYVLETGSGGDDELNRVGAGDNLGWPEESGWSEAHSHLNPILTFGKESVSPTGIVFYPRGGNFPVEYKGTAFVVDRGFGRVYNLKLSGLKLDKIKPGDMKVWLPASFAGTTFSDIAVGPDGALYLAGFSKIIRIRYDR